jgi:hypothetical protein
MTACLLYIGAEARVKDRNESRRRRARGAVRSRVLAATLVLLAACAKPYDPFRVSRDEVRGRVRTIALAPIRLDVEVTDAQRTRDAIAELATARLVAAGFGVVAPTVMDGAWRQAVVDVGPVYDPISGTADKARLGLVEDAVYRELGATHHADAVLQLRVVVVDVHLAGKTMQFCGMEDTTYWPWTGGGGGITDHATLARGACLAAVLFDMERRPLYAIQSGIESFETYARQSHAARPRASRLQNAERLARAVDGAVGPLAQTRTP